MIPTRLQRLSTGPAVAASIVAWLTVSVTVFNLGPYRAVRAAGGGEELPEERFSYTPDVAQQWFVAIGADGRGSYRMFQWFDAASSLWLCAAMALSLAYCLSRLVGQRNFLTYLVFLPLLLFALELAENVSLFVAAANFPDSAVAIVRAASVVTVAKMTLGFGLLLSTLASFAALGLRTLWQKLWRNRSASVGS